MEESVRKELIRCSEFHQFESKNLRRKHAESDPGPYQLSPTRERDALMAAVHQRWAEILKDMSAS